MEYHKAQILIIINSTYINTFTRDLNPVWTVNCVHHQFIGCILCTAADRAACVACHIIMLLNFVAKMLMLCSYYIQCLNISRPLNFTIPSPKTFTKHTIQHFKTVFWATTVCQFLSITSVVLELSEKPGSNFVNASIIFQGVTAKLYVELFHYSPLPI